MLKGCGIVLAFMLSSGTTADAQANIEGAKPGASQSELDQLKSHDPNDMGPWPSHQDYLSSSGLSGLLDRNFLTSAGETVPCPGLKCPPQVETTAPAEAKPTFHSKIKRLDDRWEKSICSNC